MASMPMHSPSSTERGSAGGPGVPRPRRDRRDLAAYFRPLLPKVVTTFAEGYGPHRFARDALAGLTVAILALPLSMAIAIGAGVDPGKGLITSVVAGFLISALGGSRYQVGGPAAAFIVIIAAVEAAHGYDGLLTATFLAGLILVAAALLKLGTYIKYVPGPVILGFTSGIGVVILLGQIKDFMGFAGKVPAETLEKVHRLWEIKATFNPSAFLVAASTLAVIALLRRVRPRWPGLLIAVVAASGAAWAFSLPVETIGTRFGGIPNALPAPQLPSLGWSKVVEVLPSTFTIAFLVGVESLLSAVAADTIAGSRHRPNAEVMAQGVANVGSALFGGLPATGVIARTGTNIASGGTSPVSGMLHACFVLAFMLLAAPLASYLALPCLAAVLVGVAWRLLDVAEMRSFLTRAPLDDRLVLAATWLLTIFVDLNVAIAVGVVMASMMFVHRMAEQPGARPKALTALTPEGAPEPAPDGASHSLIMELALPDGVAVFQFQGPLFFGVASNVAMAVGADARWPRVLILRMRDVPYIDATAVGALEELAAQCRKHDCRIVFSGLQPQPRRTLHAFGFLKQNRVLLASNSYMALERAKAILAASRSGRG
jgi:SulP family sulfate permease